MILGNQTPLRNSCLAFMVRIFLSLQGRGDYSWIACAGFEKDSTSCSENLYRYVLSKVPLRTCPRDIPSEILSPMPEYLVRQYVRHRIKFFYCIHLRPPSGCHRHSAHHQQCTFHPSVNQTSGQFHTPCYGILSFPVSALPGLYCLSSLTMGVEEPSWTSGVHFG